MKDDDYNDFGESHETWADMAELLAFILSQEWTDSRLQDVIRLIGKLDGRFAEAQRKAGSH
jgi:hypothetical protein